MRLFKAILFCLLIPVLAPADGAPSSSVAARSGHVVASTQQTVGGKTVTTVSELWFTTNRCRVVTRQSNAPVETQLFDGKAMYRWTHGSKSGHTWHPAGLRVVPDIGRYLEHRASGRKRAAPAPWQASAARCMTARGKHATARTGGGNAAASHLGKPGSPIPLRDPCRGKDSEEKSRCQRSHQAESRHTSSGTSLPASGQCGVLSPARVRSGSRRRGPIDRHRRVHLAERLERQGGERTERA